MPYTEVFAAGTHRGKTYTPGDLDDIVTNFKRYSTGPSPVLKVPAVLGHKEAQDKLDESDLPAAGWGSDLRHVRRPCVACVGKGKVPGREGPRRCPLCGGAGKRDILEQRFRDVSPEMAKLLDGKAYDSISAEIYDEPPEGHPGQGKVLRRVALLGGEQPQIKGLKSIPRSEAHAERPLRFVRAVPSRVIKGLWSCFSEVGRIGTWKHAETRPMDPDQMIAELSKRGVSEDVLKGVPPEALAEWLRSLDSGADTEDHDEDPDKGNPKKPDEEKLAEDDEDKDKLAEDGQPIDVDKAKMAERAKAFKEKADAFAAKYCDAGDTKMGEDDDKDKPVKMSEKGIARLIRREVARALDAGGNKTIDRLSKFEETSLRNQRRLAVESFCESQLKAGRLTPAEYTGVDAGGPDGPVYRRLMRLDDTTVVERFTEGKTKHELTELASLQRDIEQRPSKFAEHFRHDTRAAAAKKPGAKKEQADAELEAEVEKVEQHFEQFSEHFPRGYTAEQLAEGYKAARKADPKLTAEEFVGR